jgi:hypothetical protein
MSGSRKFEGDRIKDAEAAIFICSFSFKKNMQG